MMFFTSGNLQIISSMLSNTGICTNKIQLNKKTKHNDDADLNIFLNIILSTWKHKGAPTTQNVFLKKNNWSLFKINNISVQRNFVQEIFCFLIEILFLLIGSNLLLWKPFKNWIRSKLKYKCITKEIVKLEMYFLFHVFNTKKIVIPFFLFREGGCSLDASP